MDELRAQLLVRRSDRSGAGAAGVRAEVIAALFVEKGGVYCGLPDVDPWPEERDARKYAGPHPVVAHPPCASWCRLAGLREAQHGLKRGEDDGCFEAALASVRRWGGVLEHPAHSAAFSAFGLPIPTRAWQMSICGGWVCAVDQAAYGHRAKKATWLYAVGIDPPSMDWAQRRSVECVSTSRRKGGAKEIPKRLRSRTPEAFRDLLLSMARSVQQRP